MRAPLTSDWMSESLSSLAQWPARECPQRCSLGGHCARHEYCAVARQARLTRLARFRFHFHFYLILIYITHVSWPLMLRSSLHVRLNLGRPQLQPRLQLQPQLRLLNQLAHLTLFKAQKPPKPPPSRPTEAPSPRLRSHDSLDSPRDSRRVRYAATLASCLAWRDN